MDYGKMAYIKVDELLHQLQKKNTSDASIKNAYMLIEPKREIESGNSFFAARIQGAGTLSLIVKIGLDTLCEGELALKLGSIAAGSQKIIKTGKSYEIIIKTLFIEQIQDLSITALSGLRTTIESLEIILTGAGAGIVRTADAVCMDENENSIAAVIVGNTESLELSLAQHEHVLTAPRKNIGFGTTCDIVAAQDSEPAMFYVLYCDTSKNAWGLKVSINGETNRLYLGEGYISVAITRNDDTLIIGFVDTIGAGYFTCDNNFSARTQKKYFALPQRAVSVKFVKRAKIPSLVINCEASSYLICADPPMCSDKAALKLWQGFSVQEV